MGFKIGDIFPGGSLLEGVKGIIGMFKLSPEDRAKFEAALEAHKYDLAVREAELNAKIADYQAKEIETAADIIKTEAQSTSWLPRNVRPLSLLLLMITILVPVWVVMWQRLWLKLLDAQPMMLDDWLYITAITGFTGYTTFRSFEKKWKNGGHNGNGK